MLLKDKIHGQIEITEPIILELINTPQMQRLKKVHQNGIYHFFYPEVNTTRFEHSIGVYHLAKQFGASFDEQIAGLLHDISHGVFSHVMDHLHNTMINEEYQDSLHYQYFKNNELSRNLEKYNYNPEEIGDLRRWPLLDSPLPNICLDRLEYTLADAITISKIDQSQSRKFLNNLIVKDNQFIFQSQDIAKEFAELSLQMCIEFWHADYGAYAYYFMVEVLKKALKNKIITEDDLKSDDDYLTEKLENCSNQEITQLMKQLRSFQKNKVVEDKDEYDFVKEVTKMRVIDPLVKVDGQLKRVTEILPEFKEKFEREKERVSQPRYLKYINNY